MAQTKKKSGGCGLYGFAMIWTLFSSVFLIFGLKMCYDGLTRAQWPEIECKVTKFTVAAKRDAPPPFQPQASYIYQWEGQTYTGNKVWPNKEGEDDYEDLAEIIEQYRNGELARCFVNPESPEESALFPGGDDIWGGLVFAIMGGCFVAIGIGIMVMGRREKKEKSSALSSKKDNQNEAPLVIMIPFFSVFALAGLGILCFVVIPQWMKYNDAKSWQETPARVIWSAVRSHSDDEGTTYSVDIFYRYEFGGKTYKSNTIGLMSGSSSGRSSKQEKVDNHPRGKKITCYVNPDQPWQALLKRDLGWGSLFALFPIPFIAVGVGGIWWLLRKRKRLTRAASSENKLGRSTTQLRHTTDQEDIYRGSHDRTKASVEFTPRGNRVKGFLGILAFALFWNGIVAIFVTIAVKSWLRDDPEWFLTIFIIPFVLVGLGSLLYSFYRFLGLFSPAPVLVMKPAAVAMDGNAVVNWKLTGGSHRIRHFAIYLVGEEEARYQRGTDTKTATQVFLEQDLVDTSDRRKITRGSAEINFSQQDTPIMPSWSGTHNKIKWSLHVRGEVGLWPNIKDRYDIDILPIDITPNTP